MSGAVILQHLDDGTPCPGGYCEKCRLAWLLKGEVFYRIERDAPTTTPPGKAAPGGDAT